MSWPQIRSMRRKSEQPKTKHCGQRNRRIRRESGRNMEVDMETALRTRRCLQIAMSILLLLLVTVVIFFPTSMTSRADRSLLTSVSAVIPQATGDVTVQNLTREQPQDNEDLNDKYCFDHHDNDILDTIEHLDTFQLNSFEYEQLSSKTYVKGRLKENIDYWKNIETNSFVLDIIENGYAIPFITTPSVMFSKNNRSAFNHSDFVSQAVAELLLNNCIVQVKTRPHVVNPLTVSVQKTGKKRLIIDLREVNKHVWKNKIKFEDWRVALQYFEKNNHMYKFDLRSGYHHFDVASSSQTYLGFSWKEKCYVFTVLPFGLSSSPYIFTKCLRPLVKHWRKCGIRIVLYLDDGWGTNGDFDYVQRFKFCLKIFE